MLIPPFKKKNNQNQWFDQNLTSKQYLIQLSNYHQTLILNNIQLDWISGVIVASIQIYNQA